MPWRQWPTWLSRCSLATKFLAADLPINAKERPRQKIDHDKVIDDNPSAVIPQAKHQKRHAPIVRAETVQSLSMVCNFTAFASAKSPQETA
jgi:hypothetical protein